MSLPEPEREAEAAAAIGFDLSECVREPIHRLGMIQSHGTLLAVEADTGTVDTAALNTGSLLGIAAEELVGGPITRVLTPEHWAEALEVGAQHDAASLVLPVSIEVAGTPRMFDVTAHRQGPLLVLECESRAVAAPHFAHFYQGVRRALTRLRSSTTAAECCQAAAREIRALTGFDRVVAYRFDGENGPGEVVAEEVTEGREPWLGLWFPASDIPPQARRLYRDNWIRVIADVDDTSVGLHPPLRADSGEPLDLSNSVLRTVSGFHLEYLRNIDVKSSMSVSVLREGELWGLIACHGYTAVTIPRNCGRHVSSSAWPSPSSSRSSRNGSRPRRTPRPASASTGSSPGSRPTWRTRSWQVTTPSAHCWTRTVRRSSAAAAAPSAG